MFSPTIQYLLALKRAWLYLRFLVSSESAFWFHYMISKRVNSDVGLGVDLGVG